MESDALLVTTIPVESAKPYDVQSIAIFRTLTGKSTIIHGTVKGLVDNRSH